MPDPIGIIRGLAPTPTPPADGVFARVAAFALPQTLGSVSSLVTISSQQPSGAAQGRLTPGVDSAVPSGAIPGAPASPGHPVPSVVRR